MLYDASCTFMPEQTRHNQLCFQAHNICRMPHMQKAHTTPLHFHVVTAPQQDLVDTARQQMLRMTLRPSVVSLTVLCPVFTRNMLQHAAVTFRLRTCSLDQVLRCRTGCTCCITTVLWDSLVSLLFDRSALKFNCKLRAKQIKTVHSRDQQSTVVNATQEYSGLKKTTAASLLVLDIRRHTQTPNTPMT